MWIIGLGSGSVVFALGTGEVGAVVMALPGVGSANTWLEQPPTVEEVMHEYYIHTGRTMNLAAAEESVRELQLQAQHRNDAFLHGLVASRLGHPCRGGAAAMPVAMGTGAHSPVGAGNAAGSVVMADRGEVASVANPPLAVSPGSMDGRSRKRLRTSHFAAATRSAPPADACADGPPSAVTPPTSRRTIESHTPGGSSIVLSPHSVREGDLDTGKTLIEVDSDTDSTAYDTPVGTPRRRLLFDDEFFRHPVFDLSSPSGFSCESGLSPQAGAGARAPGAGARDRSAQPVDSAGNSAASSRAAAVAALSDLL